MTEKKTQEKIEQLQMIEQSMQQIMAQRQQFQSHLLELNSALEELEKTDKSYKIIGNIMVATDKEVLKKDLSEKKETTELRIKTIEKQETQVKEKAQALQKEIMENMKNESA